MARAMAAPRNGSSPFPSDTRPQRGSRLTSTIGLNVHEIPSALASTAAIRADSSMAFISQVHDRPRGIGKMFSYPWITSIPNNKGMPRRLSSTACRCTSRMRSTPFRLNSPPTSPLRIRLATSLLFACPVVISPVTGRLSWPIFSSSVIFFINWSIKRSISRGAFCACNPAATTTKEAASACILRTKCFMVFTVLVSIYECSDFPDANKTNLRQTDSIYPYGKNTANREKQKKKYCIGTSFHIKQFIANYLNAIIKSVRLLSGGRPSFLRRR